MQSKVYQLGFVWSNQIIITASSSDPYAALNRNVLRCRTNVQ